MDERLTPYISWGLGQPNSDLVRLTTILGGADPHFWLDQPKNDEGWGHQSFSQHYEIFCWGYQIFGDADQKFGSPNQKFESLHREEVGE